MIKKKLPSLVVLTILTLITTLFWIGFNIYQALSKEASPVVPDDVILQIDPKLDTDTITLMKSKSYSISSDVIQLATTEPIAVATATASPEATPVATVVPTVTATPSP